MEAYRVDAEVRLARDAMLLGDDHAVLLLKQIHQQAFEAQRVELVKRHRPTRSPMAHMASGSRSYRAASADASTRPPACMTHVLLR